jgi:nitronate monooxygenase
MTVALPSDIPIVAAPMAGGPSTPALVAAVSETGGLGFLAGGYLTTTKLGEDIRTLMALTRKPFGVNVFVPSAPTDVAAVASYVESLAPEGSRYGVAVGEPRWSDDEWEGKLGLLHRERPAVVSFTFGCPERSIVESLQRRDIAVWCNVTTVDEARAAVATGVDALVVQGAEAGAHRGSFTDDDCDPLSLPVLLELVHAAVSIPLVAAGGVATGGAIASVLTAGAAAAQIGTAFLLCPEAGTNDVHRAALKASGTTVLTRAFTGRRARGIVNRFMIDHDDAPSAYPEIHYATAPLRAAARAAGDSDGVNLWAGESYGLVRELPAAELVEAFVKEMNAAAV